MATTDRWEGRSTLYLTVSSRNIPPSGPATGLGFHSLILMIGMKRLKLIMGSARMVARISPFFPRVLTKRDFRSIMPSGRIRMRSEEHTSELQSRENLVCRLLLEKKKTQQI